MRKNSFETLIGAVILVVAGLFVWFGLVQGSDNRLTGHYVELGARFDNAATIERGTDVKMAGVKIGTVRRIALDRDRLEAKVTFAVRPDILPLGDGTTARVQSEGLLGGSYINLIEAQGFGDIEPCMPDEILFGKTGCGEIVNTQGSIDLMTLFASFAAGAGGDSEREP